MKKIKRIVLIVILNLFLIFSLAYANDIKAQEDSSTNAVASYNNYNIGFTNSSSTAFVDELLPSDYANFNFKILITSKTETAFKAFKIKIKTKDGTSISRAGDYTPIDLEVTVKFKDYEGTSNNIIINAKMKDYVFDNYSNYLNLEIYEITESQKTSSIYASIKCYQGYNYNLTSSNTAKYGRVLDAYYAKENYTAIGNDKIRVEEGLRMNYQWNLDTAFSSNNYYLAVRKNLANYYVGASGQFAGYSWGSNNYPDWFYARIEDSRGIVRQSQYEKYSSYSWSSFTLSPRENEAGFYEDFTWGDNIAQDNVYKNYGQTRNDVLTCGDRFQIIGSNVTLNITNGTNNSDMEARNWSMTAIIDDSTLPSILGCYILDEATSLKANTKLRIGIRFSEPVQLYGANQTISDLYAFYNSYQAINLEYVEGVGTNTLIFESDVASNILKSSINTNKIIKLQLNRDIRDYSNPDNKDKNNLNLLPAEAKAINCNLDYQIDNRRPDVTINKVEFTRPTKTKSIAIQIDNVTDDNLKFEYKLIKYDTLSNIDFDNLTDLIAISNKTDISFLDGNKDGDYFFYYKVTTNYGIQIDNRNDYESYILKYDNSPPSIKELAIKNQTNNTDYTLSFNLFDDPYGKSDPLKQISQIKVIYSDSSLFNNVDSKTIYDANTAISQYRFQKTGDNSFSFLLTADMFDVLENDYKDLYVCVIAIDIAGNETNYLQPGFESKFIKFDKRNKIGGSFEIEGNLNANINVYEANAKAIYSIDSSYDASKIHATISMYEKGSNGELQKKKINPSDYYDENISNNTYIITFKKSGYYEIVYDLDNLQFSDTYSLYVSSDGNDQTDNNYNGENVINKAYTIEGANFYYYNSDNKIAVDRYNGVTSSQMFSSLNYLREYIKYYEYKDLYAEVITEQVAINLRAGTSTINKMAKGETTTPIAGQIWIRYKKAEWNNSTLNSDWVYYYYGNNTGGELTINVNNLSMNLIASINAVVDTITASYKTVYLVTEEYTKNGIPYLDPSRIHPTKEQLTKTMLNISIINAAFIGDSKIYDTYYEEDGIQYFLASNFKIAFNKYTHIYIQGAGANIIEIDSSYSNKELKSFLDTGKYTLIEVDENGYSRKAIYIINSPPTIDVTFVTKDDRIDERTITSESNGQIFNAKNFQINNMKSFDNFDYVLIYQSNNTLKYDVYYKSDFDNNKIVNFNKGKYIVEVGDRFNNSFSFTIQVNDDNIDFKVNVVENEYIRTSCLANKEDIFTFEVYLNDRKLKATYDNNLTFKESGIYRFYLEDIYGNTFSGTYELKRTSPSVTWFYYSDNSFINIQTVTNGVYFEKISDSSYKIYTNSRLQFTFSEANDYDFIINGDCNYEENSYYGIKRISLNSFDSIIVRIYYKEFEDCYCEYTILFDDKAPNIDGYAEVNEYEYSDLNALEANTNYSDIHDLLPSITNHNKFAIVNNAEIYSNSLKFALSDNLPITYLKVIIDNKLYLEETKNIKDVYEFESYGKYEIIAQDILGNNALFTFYNKEPEYYSYSIDDIKSNIDFDPINAYQAYLYGHDNITYTFNNIESLVFLIDNNYYSFYLDNGILYQKINNDSSLILDSNNKNSTKYVTINTIAGILLRAKYQDDSFLLSINVVDDKIHQISSRCLTDLSYIPFYTSVELYNKKSEISFIKENDEKITIGNYIGYYNDLFNIAYNDSNIVSILYAYNDIQSFKDYIELISISQSFGENDGYYSFKILNKYGNITEYLIIISKVLLVDCNILYSDGYSINYTASVGNAYYTNYQAIIRIYSLTSNCIITMDNFEYSYNKIEYPSYYEIILEGNGLYNITITNENENIREFSVEINNNVYEVNDDILYGFNDIALRRNDLYTNQRISINKDSISKQGISLINMSFNNKEYILYDNISLDKVIDDNYLNSFIGSMGSGIYKLYFRNKYGTYSYKEVHYQEESLFSIYRMTKSDVRNQSYSLDEALKDGVYSNNYVLLSTSSKQYNLMVNNNKAEAPYEFKFPSNTPTGSYTYEVSYIDEYGFSYEFKVYLIRQTIEFNLNVEDYLDLDGIITVNKNFSLSFDNDYKGMYLESTKEFTYENNQTIVNDGSYLFTIVDKAGNSRKFTIRKDSIVSFEIKDTLNDKILVDGDISNSNQIRLIAANGERITILKAYLNGVLINNPSTSFTDNGKWEILVSDDVGNIKYTSFYIYTHAISSFEYKTPYNYKITDLMYKDNDGNKISYMDNVVQYDYYSMVKFEVNGTYTITMKSSSTDQTSAFEIQINNKEPQIKLIGAENGKETKKKVTISGYSEGDTILIYKDNALIQTIKVTSSEMRSPEIVDKGDYVIEVINVEGNKTTLQFRRVYTANTASSIFVIVALVGVASILFIGLFLRKKEKIE